LKVLIALEKGEEVNLLQQELEYLGHRVQVCRELSDGVRWLRDWQPDLVVSDEGLGTQQPDAGLRLAEYCRATEDQMNGWPGTLAIILIPIPDWDRFKRAQRTGAHVIVKGCNFAAVIHYVECVADGLMTDRILGPALIGIHRYSGEHLAPDCANCEWVGAEISYASSKTDVRNLTAVRISLLNVLLFRRRGQSPVEIEHICRESRFLKKVLGKHVLRESAVKMEATRLRQHLDDSLQYLGIPYAGGHFLPLLRNGVRKYGLAGNRRLIHIPVGTRMSYLN